MKLKQNQGITLVALVVTIIVLVILATVSIGLVMGNSGVYKQAEEAKKITINSQIAEEVSFNKLYSQLAEYIGGENEEPTSNNTLPKQIVTENTIAKDDVGNTIVVPKGFRVVTEEGTTVQQGIVIEDVEGNQFVWIPLGEVIKNDGTKSNPIILGRYTFDWSDGTPTLQQNAEDYATETTILGKYQELKTYRKGVASSLEGLNATAKDLSKFVTKSKENGGYYLARYEASYGSGSTTANYKPLSQKSTATREDSSIALTKGMLWNWITQLDASKVAINMYANNDTVGVESDLVNSYVWDTAIVYIQEMGNSNYANQGDGCGVLKNTGETGDKVCNIYDMASNLWEWTTEYSTEKFATDWRPCSYRGGYYGDSFYGPSYRTFNQPVYSYFYNTFRVTLYLK